ncbi:HD domain-containing protein [Polynucleobacter paneuropaeus]|uniref:HD domain-containing protein n=1 Tax=Polynucleobacter paneuropaeus TaxID=2527775 RepID=A0AAE2YMM1_9BURK|nr:HD domain-containing protein [Polynucleobacter paneuropaeus]MBT8592082.1 HD domain-containing protein [Polynucleobacter paneuropaeus]MBT8597473.1 HD domain-containing protein [Polynucleobacter paneuropaeus]MBT8599286.1 HD domain-containing protein [Polynucleobacter paneuropaeus]MBT8614530.1 HD domain-containing protein [Polynucleobacter paneuropaeus]
MQKQRWALSAFAEAAAALARAESTNLLIQEVCSAIAAQGPYVLAWVGKAEDDENKTVKFLGGAGEAIAYTNEVQVSWSDQQASGLGPAGVVIRTGQSCIIEDTQTDDNFLAWRKLSENFGIRSAMGAPIPDGGDHPFGVLLVYSKIPSAFAPTDAILFESLAKEIGFGLRAIERQHQLDDQIHEKELIQERLATSLRATIEAMSRTMEWRDPYTAGHQKRVAEISMAIARKLQWHEERVQALYMAAMVHDIGKMSVPSEILTKPSRLTSIEMQLVQGHVDSGYQILKDIPFPWPIADMVRQHHERLDGSGYPQGLKGDQISPEGRILAVADTIEAMSSHRPYRPGFGLDAAMKEIRAEAGSKLDASIVDAAFALESEQVLQKILEGK